MCGKRGPVGPMILKWVAMQPPAGNRYYAGKSGNITCFTVTPSVALMIEQGLFATKEEETG